MYEVGVDTDVTKLKAGKFRKQIIKYGNYRHPDNSLFENKKANWTFDRAEAKKMVANFRNPNIKDKVALLDTHEEETAEALGTIEDLIITKDGVDAIIDIDEPKQASVLRSGVSVGLDYQFKIGNANSKKPYADGPVLRHVARTVVPFVNGMEDYKEYVAATSKLDFGHENYTGTIVVPVEKKEEVPMTEKLRKQILALSRSTKKTPAEVADLLDVKWEDEEDDDDDDGMSSDDLVKKLTAALSKAGPKAKKPAKKSIKASRGREDDDEDGDDEDEEDDEAEALTEVERILKESLAPVTSTIAALSKGMADMGKAIKASEAAALEADADKAVATLVKAGKAMPAEKETFKKIFLSNPDEFDSFAKTLPKRVEFENDDEDEGGTVEEGDGVARVAASKVDSEIERLSKMVNASRQSGSLGRVDTITRGDK